MDLAIGNEVFDSIKAVPRRPGHEEEVLHCASARHGRVSEAGVHFSGAKVQDLTVYREALGLVDGDAVSEGERVLGPTQCPLLLWWLQPSVRSPKGRATILSLRCELAP